MSEIVVNTREQWRDYWLTCYSNRNPDADIGPGSYPWLRASVMADTLVILSNDALAISDSIPLDNMVGVQLDNKYGDKLPRLLESKASGLITLGAGSAGSTIYIGDRLSHASTKNLYEVTSATATYYNANKLVVQSVDPGLGQNLTPGEVLQWESPRPGSYATVTVFESPDGTGIAGGRSVESDDEYRERIRDYNSNPVGHGNEGDIAALIEATSEHGVPVEKAFLYPAIFGPGSLGYTFTVKPDNYWGLRYPTAAQVAAVYNYVISKLPGDFSVTSATLSAHLMYAELSVELDPRLAQWSDNTPWPTYRERGAGQYVVTVADTATSFTIGTDDGNYAGVFGPSIGNTIAVYDSTWGVFRRKKIQGYTGTGPWTITCDTTADQSDTSFSPTVGLAVSPWFDAINECAVAAGAYSSKLGPGEVVADVNIPEDGTRMRRQPRPYQDQFDNKLTSAFAFKIKAAVPSLATCEFLSPTQTTAVGTPVSVKLPRLVDIAIYKAP